MSATSENIQPQLEHGASVYELLHSIAMGYIALRSVPEGMIARQRSLGSPRDGPEQHIYRLWSGGHNNLHLRSVVALADNPSRKISIARWYETPDGKVRRVLLRIGSDGNPTYFHSITFGRSLQVVAGARTEVNDMHPEVAEEANNELRGVVALLMLYGASLDAADKPFEPPLPEPTA